MERYSKGFIPTSGTFSEGTSHLPMIPADDEKKPIIFGEALILDFRDRFYTKEETDAKLAVLAEAIGDISTVLDEILGAFETARVGTAKIGTAKI